MVCSLTLLFLAASATDVRSASRRIATICSSLNRLLRMGSSLAKRHCPKNEQIEIPGSRDVLSSADRSTSSFAFLTKLSLRYHDPLTTYLRKRINVRIRVKNALR